MKRDMAAKTLTDNALAFPSSKFYGLYAHMATLRHHFSTQIGTANEPNIKIIIQAAVAKNRGASELRRSSEPQSIRDSHDALHLPHTGGCF